MACRCQSESVNAAPDEAPTTITYELGMELALRTMMHYLKPKVASVLSARVERANTTLPWTTIIRQATFGDFSALDATQRSQDSWITSSLLDELTDILETMENALEKFSEGK